MNRPRGHEIKYGGFVVAAIGFVATRYTVLESIDATTTLGEFLLGQATFLALGLGLTVFGIGLSVSSYDESFVNTIATWSLLGTVSMVLVLGLTFVGIGDAAMVGTATQSVLVANVLIGGSIGGVLTGFRAALNSQNRRELSKQADRLTVLNRILRHEVLNKVNVIRGYADLGAEQTAAGTSSLQVIQRNADRIDDSITELRAIVGPVGERPVSTDVLSALRAAVDDVSADYPSATITLDVDAPDDVRALADAHVDTALRHLLDNAVVHAERDDPSVSVAVSTTPDSVEIAIEDEGPGIPDDVAAVLEERNLPEYDDPTNGFGLTLVRLLIVDKYGGGVDVETTGEGSVVGVELARPNTNSLAAASEYGVPPWILGVTAIAGVVAGVVMGLVSQELTGSLAIIGALYGVMNGGVGWILHLFHSLVFGVLFAVAVTRRNPWNVLRRPLAMTVVGTGYGLFLWFFASGFVMPLWLRAVGIPASVPSLSAPIFVSHAVWGMVFGSVFAVCVSRRR
ncbi:MULTISPECIES: ATP-binding protein [Haloferax]|uniref:histidine kinase n=1 Tax=Haloferax marinum TaxID=2666143 RepID=A0A6A8G910_9EURY|nr:MULTISPECIES: ATP-binding protein [Haloferax]KAB1197557.1 histidine kinase [Haloferax sp. CBA1150]MRW96606.1 histidine kinase [Haloferax marinum]